MKPLHRFTPLSHFLICAALLLLVSCEKKSDIPTLHLFTWSNLIDPEAIEEFENKYQCRVVTDLYDSNESMYAKLKLSSARYDIICPSHYYISALETQKMIQPLDVNRLDHLDDLDEKYFQPTPTPYAIPFMVSFSVIAYRQDRVHDPKPSYAIFDQANLRGRMTMLNDAREALGAALKFQGHSINSRNPTEIIAAGEQLIGWKKNLAKFESEQYKPGLASGEFLISQAYSTDIIQLQNENKNINFIFPQEGAIVSIDCFAIPINAQQLDLAYEFINFMTDTEIAAKNSEYIGALVPITPSYPLLSEHMRESQLFFPSPEVLNKMERIEDLGADVQTYYKIWDQVKAS